MPVFFLFFIVSAGCQGSERLHSSNGLCGAVMIPENQLHSALRGFIDLSIIMNETEIEVKRVKSAVDFLFTQSCFVLVFSVSSA